MGDRPARRTTRGTALCGASKRVRVAAGIAGGSQSRPSKRSARIGASRRRSGHVIVYHSRRTRRSHCSVAAGSSDMTCSCLLCSRRPATMRLVTSPQSTVIRICSSGTPRMWGSAWNRRCRARAQPAGGSTVRTRSEAPRRARGVEEPDRCSDRKRANASSVPHRPRCGRDARRCRRDRTSRQRPAPPPRGCARRPRPDHRRHIRDATIRQTQPLVAVRDTTECPPRGFVLAPADGPKRLWCGR